MCAQTERAIGAMGKRKINEQMAKKAPGGIPMIDFLLFKLRTFYFIWNSQQSRGSNLKSCHGTLQKMLLPFGQMPQHSNNFGLLKKKS